MDNTSKRTLSTIVDAGHCSCKGTCRRNTTEKRCHDIGDTLSYELGIGVMTFSCRSISHHSGEEGFNGTEDCDCEGRRYESLDSLIIKLRRYRLRHRKTVCKFRELRADGSELYAGKLAQKNRSESSDNESDKRSWNLLGNLSPAEADDETEKAHDELYPVDAAEILKITCPLRDESCRHSQIQRETEEILHLRRENRKSDTACESHYYRIRDEFKDDTHLEYSHKHKKDSRHNGSYDESLHSILRDDSCNDHDEGTGRTSDKEVGTSEE